MQQGQIVVCINTSKIVQSQRNPPPLIKGRKYIIEQISKCECGREVVDVGLADTSGSEKGIRCICGTNRTKDGIHWCSSERFAGITVNQEHVEAVERLKEEFIHQN